MHTGRERRGREKGTERGETSFTSPSIITPNEEWAEEMAEETSIMRGGGVKYRRQSTRSIDFNG